MGAKENAGYDTLSSLFFRTDLPRLFPPRVTALHGFAIRSAATFRHPPTSGVRPVRAEFRPVGPAPQTRVPALRRDHMSLALDDIKRLAHLARIDIDADATRDVQSKLDAIFGLIDELQAIDTTGVVPMAHAQDVALPLREDVVTEGDHHREYQQAAPAVAGGLYLVPKVIE
jgi:aspartyl-tRNA(Asn)/glutamyl-tRNA(Gln) amidotransferase subunit C